MGGEVGEETVVSPVGSRGPPAVRGGGESGTLSSCIIINNIWLLHSQVTHHNFYQLKSWRKG